LVTEFRKRLGSADYRGAWDLTAPSFQKERSFESFRADMRQQRDWLIGDGFEVARISLPVEESTTVVTRHGGLGRRATWSLTRETEGWRIRGLNVGGEKAHESKSDASADGGAKAPDGSAE
ncbi:MAG: hypothetical protein ABEL76_03825, partial [Bradymonadaceae bacterium]